MESAPGSELRQRLVAEFPAIVIHWPSPDLDFDLRWCQEALLALPWTALPLDTILMNRECTIYLSAEQVLSCLPAFLDAAVQMAEGGQIGEFYDCITFLRMTVTTESVLVPLTSHAQRILISDVLLVVAQFMERIEELEDSATWREYSHWWASQVQQ